MPLPFIDKAFVWRIVQDEMCYMRERFGMRIAYPGNPTRTELIEIPAPDDGPGALGTLVPTSPEEPYFNRIVGLRAGMEAHIAPLIARYKKAGVKIQVEIAPGSFSPAFARALADAGLVQADMETIHAAVPDELRVADEEPSHIRPVISDEEVSGFIGARAAGWDVSREECEVMRKMENWAHQSNWYLFNAWQGDVVAGIGVLTLRGSLACLAEGAVVPEYRGHGLQRDLISARVRLARRLGATLIWSETLFGLHSARNIRKVGLFPAYDFAVWNFA